MNHGVIFCADVDRFSLVSPMKRFLKSRSLKRVQDRVEDITRPI